MKLLQNRKNKQAVISVARLLLCVALLVSELVAPAKEYEAAPHKPEQKQENKRPNIVIIMVDDMGFSDIGSYGSEISTPNLDRLAAKGQRFTQFYNAGRCCPSRASLLTGLYPHQAGMGDMVERDLSPPASYRNDLNRSSVTIAEALRGVGYGSCALGKWHVTPYPNESKHNYPLQRGFDRFYGTLSGISNIVQDNTVTNGKPGDEKFNYTDAITTNAVNYIDEYAKKDKPLFLYIAYTAPHYPLWAEAEEITRYRGRYMNGWDAVRESRYRRMVDAGVINRKWTLPPRDDKAPMWTDIKDKPAWDLKMAVYAAQMTRMDAGVGRILAELEKAGADKNTLVLFLSDNGAEAVQVNRTPGVPPGGKDSFESYGLPWANASNTPFRFYKSRVHEGGIATPLIAYWSGVTKPNSITHQPGHIIDLMATCLDVAGAKYPQKYNNEIITPLEGKSLVPIFRGRTRAPHAALFWEHEGNRAVRQGKWKLVARFKGDWELYDMDADRTELRNLASKYPQKVAELAAQYERWANRVGVVEWEQVTRSGTRK